MLPLAEHQITITYSLLRYYYVKFSGCITTVTAYDPDIPDRNADQHIVYSILKSEHQSLMGIDKDGCMRLKKKLDRDPPHGYPVWVVSTFLVVQFFFLDNF